MHRATITRSVLIATALGLMGCVHPQPMYSPVEPEPAPTPVVKALQAAPTQTNSQAVALPAADDGTPFYDLTEAYGLKVSLDLVTGRRTCRDGINTVVVMPSARQLVINGIVHPLDSQIRWRNGVLYLPTECRTLFALNLKSVPVPEVDHDPSRFDGSEVALQAWNRRRSAPQASISPRQKAASLPTAWRVRGERTWRYIVIHHSATQVGCAASFHRSHIKKWKNGLGYHFVIGNGTSTPDGKVEVGPRWMRQGQGIDGAHAGNKKYNKWGIGICLVGDYNTHGPTPRQLVALRRLCRTLMARYGIKRNAIFPHRDVRKGHTDCPGKDFPFTAFVNSL